MSTSLTRISYQQIPSNSEHQSWASIPPAQQVNYSPTGWVDGATVLDSFFRAGAEIAYEGAYHAKPPKSIRLANAAGGVAVDIAIGVAVDAHNGMSPIQIVVSNGGSVIVALMVSAAVDVMAGPIAGILAYAVAKDLAKMAIDVMFEAYQNGLDPIQALRDYFQEHYPQDEEKVAEFDTSGLGIRDSEAVSRDLNKIVHSVPAIVSPLSIDLDGDGIETLSVANGVNFDHDGNGFAERTGWISSDDGILALDRNNNGTIDSGQELFGNNTLKEDGTKHRNGFEALSELDENGDGVVDQNDSMFQDLTIWKDLNSNGIAELGELSPLSALGVSSIGISYVTSDVIDENGNAHAQLGGATKATGEAITVADIWFRQDASSSVPLEQIEVSSDIDSLPDLDGFGSVYSLHQAMARDASGILENLVRKYIADKNPLTRHETLVEIVLHWSQSQDVPSVGGYVDSRVLRCLGNFLGSDYASQFPAGVDFDAAKRLNAAFLDLVNWVGANLLLQSHYGGIFAGALLSIDEQSGVFVFDSSAILDYVKEKSSGDICVLKALLDEFAVMIPSLGTTGINLINQMRKSGKYDGSAEESAIALMGYVVMRGTDGNDEIKSEIASNVAMLGGNGDDKIIGNSGDSLLIGGDGNDTIESGANLFVIENSTQSYDVINTGETIIVGGLGEDTLKDSYGRSTVYKFSAGDGGDVIYDTGGSDTILFEAGIISSDVTLHAVGNNLLIKYPGGSVLVANYFSGVNASASLAWVNSKIEKIEFSTGEKWSSFEIETLTVGQSELPSSSLFRIADLPSGFHFEIISDPESSEYDVAFVYPGGSVRLSAALASGVSLSDALSDLQRTASGYSNSGQLLALAYRWGGVVDLGAVDFTPVGDDPALIKDIAVETPSLCNGFSLWIKSGDLVLSTPAGEVSMALLIDRGWIENSLDSIIRTYSMFDVSVMSTSQAVYLMQRMYGQLLRTQENPLTIGTDGNDRYYGNFSRLYTKGGDDYFFGAATVVSGGAGDDDINIMGGSASAIIGGSGNDLLTDEVDGGDTQYYFNIGDGYDVIRDVGGADSLVFLGGIEGDDITVRITGDVNTPEVFILYPGGSIELGYINYQGLLSVLSNVESLVFSDGTSISVGELIAKNLPTLNTGNMFYDRNAFEFSEISASEASDVVICSNNSKIASYGGDDILLSGYGKSSVSDGFGDDVIILRGDDSVNIGSGSNKIFSLGVHDSRYIFNADSGITTVIDDGGDDEILLNRLMSDVLLSKIDNDLIVDIGNSSIVIVNGASAEGGSRIERVTFSDGTSVDVNDFLNLSDNTSQNEKFTFSRMNYCWIELTSDGHCLFRYPEGVVCIDSFCQSTGMGIESIINYVDQGLLGESFTPEVVNKYKVDLCSILTAVFSGVDTSSGWFADLIPNSSQQVLGTDGADSIYGHGDEIVYAGSGDDLIISKSNSVVHGDQGGDTIIGGMGYSIFYGGDGDDVIVLNGIDTVSGDRGNDKIYAANAHISRILLNGGDGNDTIYLSTQNLIRIAFGDTVSVQDVSTDRLGDDICIQYGSGSATIIDFFKTNKVGALTMTFSGELSFSPAQLARGTNNDDQLYGDSGDNVIVGLAGSDALYGDAGNDILDGGAGDDMLIGAAGADVYLFGTGSGHDAINNYDNDEPAINADTILLGAGITTADVTLARSGDALVIGLNASDDSLRVQSYFYNDGAASYAVENIQFADGTVWDMAAVKSWLLTPTTGDDTLFGFAGDDTIYGDAGNDTLYGNAGDDVLDGGNGNDNLQGGVGNDTIYGGSGGDTLQGGEDNDSLYGDASNDILDGGAGDDTLNGGAGADVYLFGTGSGHDTINNYDLSGTDDDRVAVGAGISEGQIWLQRSGNDLQLMLLEASDSLTVHNWYGDAAYHVASFDLSNGKRLLEGQVDALVSAMSAFAPPAAGQTTLPTDYQAALNSVIAASWK